MRHSISLCRVTGAAIVLCSLLLASTSGAQQNPNPNSTNPQLQALDQFLDSHPQISADLKKNPALVKDANYLKKHAALADFLRQHPYIKQTISENPGAITKRVKGQEGQEIRPNEVRTFNDFLDLHPAIANDLRKDPMLGVNGGYLQSHAELSNFFRSHSAVYAQYSRDPAAFMSADRALETREQGGVGPQPHMQVALRHLKEAKKELESAGQDKGGHRRNAISLTDKAEAEVEAGMQYAIQHAQKD